MFQVKNFKLNNPELEAEIYYLTKEGGRATIVAKGKITKILEPAFQKKDKTAPS